MDLDRYAGRWYVIANIPYFAESGNVGSYFDVSFQPGGELNDVYNARNNDFERPADIVHHGRLRRARTGNARWRESPFWPLFLSYLILYVDPDYQTTLVGYPAAATAGSWRAARTSTIPPTSRLLNRLRDQGYDTSLFRRVPQTPGQIGNPGFQ